MDGSRSVWVPYEVAVDYLGSDSDTIIRFAAQIRNFERSKRYGYPCVGRNWAIDIDRTVFVRVARYRLEEQGWKEE
jgi:hypothetical protein